MADLYLRVFQNLPEFLKRRIHPVDYGIRDFVCSVGLGPERRVIVDAGAGEVRFSEYFSGHVFVAMDSRVGDSKWDYSKIDVCADLCRIPVASGKVDLVISTQVLEHVPNPGQVLLEIARILRPGGRLLLTAPQGWHEHQQPHDYFRFTRYALRNLIEEAGFREVEIQPLGGYFHYLGHRLTYIPKILFASRAGLSRILLFPIEILSLGLFCFLFPILCYYLDSLDRKKEFTLVYRVEAVK